jgi:hypothetical protein
MIYECYNAYLAGTLTIEELSPIQRDILNQAQHGNTSAGGMILCRDCQAPIMWVRFKTTGSLAPINREPVPTGNIVIKDNFAHTLSANLFEAGQDDLRELPRYVSHFSTCPNAKNRRRKNK